MTTNPYQVAMLRPKHAASYLGVSVATLARLRSTGAGPEFTQVHSTCIAYSIDALNTWLAARPKYHSTSERTVAGAAA